MWVCVFVLHAHMCIKEKHPHGRDLESLSIIDLFFVLSACHPWPSFETDASFIYAFFFLTREYEISMRFNHLSQLSEYLFFGTKSASQGSFWWRTGRSCWQSWQSFYLNCCQEGKRMTDSRLRAKPNLSTFRTFALQGLMFWTLPTLHRTTNATVTLTWADLDKDNPCFLIDGVKTLSSSSTF